MATRRQLYNELNSGLALRIHLPGREAHSRSTIYRTLARKIPEYQTLLMDEQGTTVSRSAAARWAQAAIQAPTMLPYAVQPSASGVALELKDGTIFHR